MREIDLVQDALKVAAKEMVSAQAIITVEIKTVSGQT